ncbi:MAG: TfoX/Sxy family protein [Acidobacteriales bacterium]|nr:TfoX/Sxy family protein [Terriglobales bacterium]
MAFDERLAQRVRELLRQGGVAIEKKRMMGGLCFMVNGKMCVGIEKDRLMARIDADAYEAALGRRGCIPMDFTGRPMRGFVFVTPEGTKSRTDLQSWIDLALEFNLRALASRRPRTARQKKTARPSTLIETTPSTTGKRKK